MIGVFALSSVEHKDMKTSRQSYPVAIYLVWALEMRKGEKMDKQKIIEQLRAASAIEKNGHAKNSGRVANWERPIVDTPELQRLRETLLGEKKFDELVTTFMQFREGRQKSDQDREHYNLFKFDSKELEQ